MICVLKRLNLHWKDETWAYNCEINWSLPLSRVFKTFKWFVMSARNAKSHSQSGLSTSETCFFFPTRNILISSIKLRNRRSPYSLSISSRNCWNCWWLRFYKVYSRYYNFYHISNSSNFEQRTSWCMYVLCNETALIPWYLSF